MTSATNLLFFSCLFTILHNFSVLSLSCAVCTYRDPGCTSGNVLPSPCEEGSTNCYVINLYMLRHGQGTFRGCADDGVLSEGCRRTQVGSRDAVACSMFCDWEGCNSAYGNAHAISNNKR